MLVVVSHHDSRLLYSPMPNGIFVMEIKEEVDVLGVTQELSYIGRILAFITHYAFNNFKWNVG